MERCDAKLEELMSKDRDLQARLGELERLRAEVRTRVQQQQQGRHRFEQEMQRKAKLEGEVAEIERDVSRHEESRKNCSAEFDRARGESDAMRAAHEAEERTLGAERSSLHQVSTQLLFALDYVCPQLLFALDYVCPQLLFALNYCLPFSTNTSHYPRFWTACRRRGSGSNFTRTPARRPS